MPLFVFLCDSTVVFRVQPNSPPFKDQFVGLKANLANYSHLYVVCQALETPGNDFNLQKKVVHQTSLLSQVVSGKPTHIVGERYRN